MDDQHVRQRVHETPTFVETTVEHIKTTVIGPKKEREKMSVPDQIAAGMGFKIKLPLVLLLIGLYLWYRAPFQEVTEQQAKLILHGCSFDPETKVLWTNEGSFKNPNLYDTGPTTTDGFNKRPEFVTLRHTTGWLSEHHSTLKRASSIRCVLKLLGDHSIE